MKTKRFFSAAAVALSLFAVSATNKTISNNDECKQCGVDNATIQRYLETCSHHHTVYWVQDIAGTCNSNAGIENCGVSTVYVSNGIIISHTDGSGFCN